MLTTAVSAKEQPLASARRGISSPWARYAVAATCAGLAVVVRLGLDPLWGPKVPFITFYPAIMVSAWLGGFGPGMVTTLLCAAAAAYWWLPAPRPTSSTSASTRAR